LKFSLTSAQVNNKAPGLSSTLVIWTGGFDMTIPCCDILCVASDSTWLGRSTLIQATTERLGTSGRLEKFK
jgi:hypothetical protein